MFGRHPSRFVGHFGIPDTLINDKRHEDSTRVSHAFQRTMKPVEYFLGNCAHTL